MVKGTTPSSQERRPLQKKRKLSISDGDDVGTEVVARPHSAGLHSIENVMRLRTNLLNWFETVRDARGMPWRRSVTEASPEKRAQRAYEVWVSEIMLQQTQVATVIPYYTRWMEKFPTVRDLAAADIDTVNSLWKGLGYYSRAARLLAGAQKVVTKFGGYLPADVKTLETEIPGIGRYSAGAICSIAYGICAPVLDGNVHRLLSRILALHASPKAKKTLDILWTGAEAMVECSDRPGDINQALIELGSTVCKVREPICESCPLKEGCGAHRELKGARGSTVDIEDLCELCEPVPSGRSVTRFPMKVVKKKVRTETDAVNIVEWSGNGKRYFALVRRPEGGLLAGLYEFPSRENIDADKADMLGLSHSVLNDLLESPPPRYKPSKENATVNANAGDSLYIADIRYIGETLHIFSHIRKTYRIFSVVLQGGSSLPQLSNNSQHSPKKRKSRNINADDSGVSMKWIPEEKVSEANIGTGVLNVWKKATAVWDLRKG